MDAISVRALLARAYGVRAGQVAAVLHAAPHFSSLPERLSRALQAVDPGQLTADLQWINASGAVVLVYGDLGYPEQLLAIPRPPVAIYVLGSVASLSRTQVALVGSRSSTRHGEDTARRFAAHFAHAGVTVTSGLALGIDAASHDGALCGGGETVAVCGTGLDRVYPIQHQDLARRIRERGALLSEFPPGTAPEPQNFPLRNRLISGLSRGVVVVEAARNSGSLITARHALEQGKKVFALPGLARLDSSRGCHELIRNGARLVETPSQVLQELKVPHINEGLGQLPLGWQPPGPLDKEYEMLLDAVGFEPSTVDMLTARTGLPVDTITSLLLVLELQGRVAPYPSGQFGRIP